MRGPSIHLPERLEQANVKEAYMPKAANKDESESEPIADRITRVWQDLRNLLDFYNVHSSPFRYSALHEYLEEEIASLRKAPFDQYDQNGKIDYLLLKSYLRDQLATLQHDAEAEQKVLAFLGGFFPVRLARLIEARQKVENTDGKAAASALTALIEHIAMVKDRIAGRNETAEPAIALRATKTLADLRSHLEEWYQFYKDYDPLFTWWVSDPYTKTDACLAALHHTIYTVVLGIEPSDKNAIIGEPIRRAGILDALEAEMIPYSPEELIKIGHKEYEWCEVEMQKAALDMGIQNWRDALENVKNQYVSPGQQPQLVRDLTKEATEYVKEHDLVTVPVICEKTIRTYMMTPADQKMNPFFLGGDSIIVSYPTSSMSHDEKLMSMRGNNIHFARATVFHEMIPGHHLHMHYMARHRPYRQMFTTPFCIEGWAFYWEMVLWDKESWKKTPENRIGMLFWRMHRCARIVFSLKYHLGEMTAKECVELLVNWVGHERATAEGEVRRSVMGDYGPLYQAGYMLGGLQLYALRKEMLKTGLKEKVFHDMFLKANQMPVELFRALIQSQSLDKEWKSRWRFYDALDEGQNR